MSAPGFPPGYAPGYSQGQQPGYPAPTPGFPPGYGQQSVPPQGPPAPTGTLDQFFNQSSGGAGKPWKFSDMPNGTTYQGLVARPVTNADVQAAANPRTGQVQTQRDGSPKWVMIVPMLMVPDQTFPDGRGAMYVKGDLRDKLAAAMAAVGAPEGPPESGAFVQATKVMERPVPGMNNQFLYEVIYRRPDDDFTRQFRGQIDAAMAAVAGQPAPVANGYGQQQPANPSVYPNRSAQQPTSAPMYPNQSVPQNYAQYPPQSQPPMQVPPPSTPAPAQMAPVPQPAAVSQPAAQQVTTPDYQAVQQAAAQVATSDQPVAAPQGGIDPSLLSGPQQELYARLTGQGQPTG